MSRACDFTGSANGRVYAVLEGLLNRPGWVARDHPCNPERAANPVRLYCIDAMPVTGVGKIFKPALRLEAARRRVTQLLGEIQLPGFEFQVDATSHEVHGSLLIVNVSSTADASRERVGTEIARCLGSMPMRHEVRWMS